MVEIANKTKEKTIAIIPTAQTEYLYKLSRVFSMSILIK